MAVSLNGLREEDREYTYNEEILHRLQENYFSTVGRKFQPSKELEEFLMEHWVELPVLAEEDHIGLDVEFSKEEVKKPSPKPRLALPRDHQGKP